jgi:hypothetical protein
VKVTIAVPRIERFYRHGDQEIALSRMADPFALCGSTDSIGLMQWVRNMVGESGSVQYPLGIGGPRDRGKKRSQNRYEWNLAHLTFLEFN